MDIKVRKASEADHPFIYSTYLKHNWYSVRNTSVLRKDTWMRIQHGRLENILTTRGSWVVCLLQDPDVILGYLVPDVDSFVYLRPQWRDSELDLRELLFKEMNNDKS
jgi:hypothetical protein